jgi:hypothetical protein
MFNAKNDIKHYNTLPVLIDVLGELGINGGDIDG